MKKDAHLNAWCSYPFVEVPHSPSGELSGMTFAVKDIFPVAGYPNGWGQPTKLAEGKVDSASHSQVQKLLDAGARCLGKSQCEELCYSLMGSNKHYGQPINSRATDRLSGGSSSGSAALVAGGAVDIATASDTAGSVRAPASFCGLIGLRITHGRLPLKGAMPLAPSFDCFGWYAKDIKTYAQVADVMLGSTCETTFKHLKTLGGIEQLLAGDEERAVYSKTARLVQEHFEHAPDEHQLAFSLQEAAKVFSVHQSYEAWQALGAWVTAHKPDLQPSIQERFTYGATLNQQDFQWAANQRRIMARELYDVMGTDSIVMMPTVPSCAPLKSASAADLATFRAQMLQLLCLSGLAGLPQITLPLGTVHGAPFGISLMGPNGSDRALVALAHTIMQSIVQSS